MSKTKSIIEFIVAVWGVFAALYGLTYVQQAFADEIFDLPWRMVLMVVTQRALFLVPGLLMLISKERLRGLGFGKEKIPVKCLSAF